MKTEYLTYDAVALAMEHEFQAWVMDGTQDEDWLQWLKAHPETSAVVEEAKSLVKSIQIKSVKSNIDEKQLWNKIDQATPAAKKQSGGSGRRRFLRFAAAAAAGLALLIFVQINRDSLTEVQTSFAQTELVQLPDMSKVNINAGSSLSFSEKSWKANRAVQLNGEAFFEVQKGERFVVNTPEGTIEVLGTSFNVFSREGKFRVHCKTGKVAVRVNGQEQILTPGEEAYLENKQLKKMNIGATQPVEWLAGIYRFEEVALSEVLNSVQRQFDYQIELPAELTNIKYSGLYQTNAIDSAMYQITWPLNLKYTIEGKKIVVGK